MTTVTNLHALDTPALRKSRGAFFTPSAITEHIASWAIRDAGDRVFEPSAGDAAFLVAATTRLLALRAPSAPAPRVDGVEIHAHSARVGRQRVRDAGGNPTIRVSDFFAVEPKAQYDCVIGNPPYVRYQDFQGDSRSLSRAAALRAGVALSALASSWAAFTVHSALFLKPGGRLGLVLPAELMSVNYASAVRKFLFDSFKHVEIVLFAEQVFPDAEADVVLVLADGFGEGPTSHGLFRQTRNAETLVDLEPGTTWTPSDPAGKWLASIVDANAVEPLHSLRERGLFTDLETWGDTSLGIVTGNNKYFTLTPGRASELRLPARELVRITPPGSSHLRGLSFTSVMMRDLGDAGRSTYLFAPGEHPSAEAQAYIDVGKKAGVNEGYKCRIRKNWFQVPLVQPADLFLTAMNADTPRITTNAANARHLNSVYGVYLADEHKRIGRQLLPIASLNSVSLLNAEMVGRSYGGGILKLEPREADGWSMPSPALIAAQADALHGVRDRVARLLRNGRLLEASQVVDQVLLVAPGHVRTADLDNVRRARASLTARRTGRSSSKVRL